MANFVKCNCQHCGKPIEFDRDAIDLSGATGADILGNTAPCPHCGMDTILVVPKPTIASKPDAPVSPTPKAPKNYVASTVDLHIIAALFVVGGFLLLMLGGTGLANEWTSKSGSAIREASAGIILVGGILGVGLGALINIGTRIIKQLQKSVP